MLTFFCTCTHVRIYSLCTTKFYSVLSTTLYYKVQLQYYSVLLQYYSVLQSTTLYYSSATLYYKVLLCTTPVLLCTTKYYSSTTLYYKALLQYYVKPCRNISVNSLRPERSQIYAPSDPKFTPEAIQNLRPKRPRALSAVGLTSTPASNWFSPRRTAWDGGTNSSCLLHQDFDLESRPTRLNH